MKIKKGDLVLVIKGKDRGKTGKVTSVDPINSKVKVNGINIVKRHTKARGKQAGGIVETAMAINISKLMLVCQPCGSKPVRTGYKLNPGGTKERVCKKCKSVL
ncbi:50S ribosomal protein L24 [Patescibacteria group bacterium]|nr:50S ribosomal protein L24 [Patescibacteria group bacterium]